MDCYSNIYVLHEVICVRHVFSRILNSEYDTILEQILTKSHIHSTNNSTLMQICTSCIKQCKLTKHTTNVHHVRCTV